MGRVKGNGSSGNGKIPQNNAKLYQLQFQELQDILDQESEKLIHLKNSYSQQNVAMAKENSLLKIKLNEMESKVSGLIQENVSVRSHITLTQSQYKHQLHEKLQEMENQLIERFQSILDMFQQVRVQENLPVETHRHNNGLNSNRLIDLPSSLPTSKDYIATSKEIVPITINACAPESSSSPSVNSTSSRKRRKSSRRQSMFVPSDFEFPIDNDDVNNQEPEQEPLQTEIQTEVQDSEGFVFEKHSTKEDNEGDFTNSIIDYSIPEENDTRPHQVASLPRKGSSAMVKNNSMIHSNIPSSSSSSVPSDSISKTKLNIFRDDDEEVEKKNDQKIQTLKENIIAKHSIKPPRIKNKKRKIVDEIMPVTNYPEINQPTRRTRGKTVNYTLPSLRSKMRRPTEKLVDATTTINIKDLQVNNRRMRAKERRTTVPSGHVNPLIDNDEIENEPTSTVVPEKLHEFSQPSSSSIVKDVVDIKKKRLIVTKSSSPLVEKDINKRRPTSQKKKLFRKAIVNDLNDDINDSGMNSSTRANKSVSFRLNDEDLSVFDLIPAKVNTTPKTYKNNLTSNNSLLGKRR